ncbi:MAG: PEGA domain-containing protein [Myxococcota bacterium]
MSRDRSPLAPGARIRRLCGVVVALALMVGIPVAGFDAPIAAAAEGDEAQAGAKYYERAVRYVRARKYDKALEWFEKALPHRNETSDIFYNLVNVAEAVKDWEKVYLYAVGFLYLEPDTADADDIRAKKDKAARVLGRRDRAPVAVTFDVKPRGVQVLVDHVPVVRSARKPVELIPGEYTATADKPDHHPWEKTFEVVAGAPREVEGEVKPMIFHGKLKVVTHPAEGVKVYVDDEYVGTTPLDPIELETRKYLIRFEKEGWDKWIRYVTIQKEETFVLEPHLERTVNGKIQRAE